jgi:hypothetical protein
MFDGGGAPGGAGAAGTGAAASTDGASSSQPEVVYGKDEDESTTNNDVGDHGSGSDRDGVEKASSSEPDLDAEFEKLIKGQYKEQYGARVQQALSNRFKNQADYEGQVSQYQDALKPLMQIYGLQDGDLEGLKQAIEGDDGLIAHKADEEGLTVERYRHQLKLEMEAARGRAIDAALTEERERQATYERWENEAANLQEAFPSFDLAREINETPGFGNYLDQGLSVEDAFFLAHKGDILGGATQTASEAAKAQTISNLKSRAARPAENGSKPAPAIVRKTDPSTFTRDDLLEVARRARAGEKIVF